MYQTQWKLLARLYLAIYNFLCSPLPRRPCLANTGFNHLLHHLFLLSKILMFSSSHNTQTIIAGCSPFFYLKTHLWNFFSSQDDSHDPLHVDNLFSACQRNFLIYRWTGVCSNLCLSYWEQLPRLNSVWRNQKL